MILAGDHVAQRGGADEVLQHDDRVVGAKVVDERAVDLLLRGPSPLSLVSTTNRLFCESDSLNSLIIALLATKTGASDGRNSGGFSPAILASGGSTRNKVTAVPTTRSGLV